MFNVLVSQSMTDEISDPLKFEERPRSDLTVSASFISDESSDLELVYMKKGRSVLEELCHSTPSSPDFLSRAEQSYTSSSGRHYTNWNP
jgi:hypothetical protein